MGVRELKQSNMIGIKILIIHTRIILRNGVGP